MSYMVKEEPLMGSTQVLGFGGELDMQAAPELRETIDRALAVGTSRLVVDLTEARFIDSTGIGVLVAALRRLRPGGGSLELVCSDPNLLRIFELVGLDREIAIYPTRDLALEALAGVS